MPNGPDRRSVLRAGAALGSLSLAGCLGVIDGDSGDETDDDGNSSDSGNVSDDAGGSGSDDGGGNGDPDWETIETWPQLQYDAQNTGYVHAEAPTDVEELWSVEIDEVIPTSPVVADGTVYIRDKPGTVYAIEDGDVHWTTNTSRDSSTEGTPVLHEDLLVVPTEDGLVGIERVDGSVRWERSLSDYPRRLTLADGVVYLATWSSEMYAVEAASGEQRWAQPGGFFGTPAVYDGEVFVLSGGGRDTPPHLRALNIEKGRPRPALQPDVPINTSVAVRDDTFYLGADDGVYAFDPESEEQLWHHETDRPVHALPTVSPDAVYAITSDQKTEGRLYCLAKNGGDERWNADAISSHAISPTVVGGQVASTRTAREIAGWNTENGTRSWAIETGFDTFPSFAFAEGTYYAGSIGGTVYAWG